MRVNAPLPMNEGGHIQVGLHMETSIPGVYACGDIRQNSARQAIAAKDHLSRLD